MGTDLVSQFEYLVVECRWSRRRYHRHLRTVLQSVLLKPADSHGVTIGDVHLVVRQRATNRRPEVTRTT